MSFEGFLDSVLYSLPLIILGLYFSAFAWMPEKLTSDKKDYVRKEVHPSHLEGPGWLFFFAAVVLMARLAIDPRGTALAALFDIAFLLAVPKILITSKVAKLRRNAPPAPVQVKHFETTELEKIIRQFDYASRLLEDEGLSASCHSVSEALKTLHENPSLRDSAEGKLAIHSASILARILDSNHLAHIHSWPSDVKSSFGVGLENLVHLLDKARDDQAAHSLRNVRCSLEALNVQQSRAFG